MEKRVDSKAKNSLFSCSQWEFFNADSDTFSPAKWLDIIADWYISLYIQKTRLT